MSYHLIDFTQNIDEFDFDNNIIIGKKVSNKYYLYYIDNSEQLGTSSQILDRETKSPDVPRELYIKLPQIRSIYKLGTSQYNQENIPLYPNYNLLNEFIEFISKLENNIHLCFLKKYPDILLSSIINKRNNIYHIKVNITDTLKNKFKDIMINNELNIVVKLSYIWNKDNIKIGLFCDLYQIKYDHTPINFFDNKKNVIPIKPPITNTNNNNDNIDNSPTIPSPPRISLVPSIADLQFAIKKLKPATKTE